MKNIFEKAYFGKPYKTRDERKAIYIGMTYKGDYSLHVDKGGSVWSNDIYNNNGKMVNNKSQADSPYDIVSECPESINEEELDILIIKIQTLVCAWNFGGIDKTPYKDLTAYVKEKLREGKLI